MVSFLIAEREKAGWRFLLFWLIASNLGFMLGVLIEMLVVQRPTLYLAVPLSAVGQAYVLNRHISIYLPWAVGTAIFWIIGLLIGNMVIDIMIDPTGSVQLLIFLAASSLFGGAFAGFPQWLFAKDWLPQVGLWWIVFSAIGYALLVPGLVSGLALMYFLTLDKIPMEGRHYQLTGDY